MSTYAWVVSYAEHCLPADCEFRCIIAHDGSNLKGVLPVTMRRRDFPGMRYTESSTPHDEHTFSVEPLVALPPADTILQLLSALRESVAYPITVVFTGVPASSTIVRHARVLKDDWWVLATHGGLASYIPTTGNFDEIESNLSRNFRRNLVKARNKLERLSGVRFEYLTSPADNAARLKQFLELEASGWKGEAGTAIQESPVLRRFYGALTERLARAGLLEWQVLSADDRILAMNLAVKLGRTLNEVKICYDEDYRRCMPGGMLLEDVLRRACESPSIDRVDLLTDMAWHETWKPEKREYHHLYVHSGHLATLATSYIPLQVRQLLKRIPGLVTLYRRMKAAR